MAAPGGNAALWAAVAARTAHWLDAQGLAQRDVVLLLPFAALLAPARAALAAAGGWQPRVETPLTLAASLGAPLPAARDDCSGNATQDRISAALLLRRQAWGAAWQRTDPGGFERIVADVADAAQALRAAALLRAPDDRDAFWRQARALTVTAGAPALTEALLLRVALEWAATSGPADTDRLFALRPSAWVALQIGGPDLLAEALLGHAATPSLRLLADAPADDPFGAVAAAAGAAQLQRLLCDDFEAEAQAVASTVIDGLNRGQGPLALVALDRELVRRVRALLERAAVPLVDETGWLLATTPAANSVVALLQAALPGAGPDARLGWLKTWPPARQARGALDALEALWRGRRHVPRRAAAEQLWAHAEAHLQALARPAERTLAAWLAALHDMLAGDGSLTHLAAGAAGQQLIDALGLAPGTPWLAAAAELRLDLPGFIAWVESTLERTPFLPLPDPGAQVVLTPLARAFGRPFRSVIVPAADHLHLGSAAAPPTLIGERLADALGIETGATRRLRQRLALAQLLRVERVTLLRRRRDADAPLAESPDVEWLLLARARAHGSAQVWPLQRWLPALTTVAAAPVARPLPVAAAALPAALSASQLEALRQCPYRFFARAVLRLDDPDELEAGLAKRDYGNWLHAVLHRFHDQREAGADDLAALQRAADAVTREQNLDAAELLPYRAGFETFAPAYVGWLADREQRGWVWHSGESEHELLRPELNGLRLRGRIDRLDHGPAGMRQLIDYKTGSVAQLKQRVAQPLEDTQLAFYAALVGAADADDGLLAAAYLALDDADAPREIAHPDVHRTALALLQGLAGEWRRLRDGAALPALGEGRVCETCEARGLCRRDQWSA